MNQATIRSILIAALAAVCWTSGARAAASEAAWSVTPDLSYIWVDGDSDKFRAHHWLTDRFEGGAHEFTVEQANIGNGYELYGEGHAAIARSDYAYDMMLRKEDASYVHVDFQQYRKYYDSTGGVYHPFVPLEVSDSNRELYVDMGKLEIEYGLTPEYLPDLTLGYEFEYKQGVKSRLTWATAQEGSVSKKITPSWQEINEDVHKFDLKLEDNWQGTNWKVEQSWEKVVAHNLREEVNLSTTPNTAGNETNRKIRDQEQSPSSSVIESMVELDRWIVKDKLHGATAYRFGQVQNEEIESIFELNSNRVPQNFSNPEQVRNAVAENYLRTNTVVANLMWVLNPDLTLIGKAKFEDATRRSSSTHPADRSPAGLDNVIDQNDTSETSDGIRRLGQGLSIRYSGLPGVSIYNDLEFEQITDSLQENRQSNSSGEVFARQSDGSFNRGTETIGLRWYPNEVVRVSSQYRYRRANGDLDDVFETDPAATGAKSAFVDEQNEDLHEVASRVSVKFCEWFEPAFRYRFRTQEFNLRYEGNPLELGSTTQSHIYTVDVPLQPTQALNVTTSLQWQDAFTVTPADEASLPNTLPQFDSDVWTVMVAADYAIHPDAALMGTFQYQTADNFNDVATAQGFVPYGTDYDQYEFTVGLRLQGLKKGVTVEPKYGFYHYDANDLVEFGDYDAHVIWLGVRIDWP